MASSAQEGLDETQAWFSRSVSSDGAEVKLAISSIGQRVLEKLGYT